MLRKQSGNMYNFVSHTWNPIKGACLHDCSYCYMKRFKLNPVRLDQRELKTDLGKDNFIFVGSSTDMFASDIPSEWIDDVLATCLQYDNKYLFQSKNPGRFEKFSFPEKSILGTTIETNRHYEKIMNSAPMTRDRAFAMSYYKNTMITIEPIMDFDLIEMEYLIKLANPLWVNIGADSRGCGLPEPPKYKVEMLIERINALGVKLKLKDNLKRIME